MMPLRSTVAGDGGGTGGDGHRLRRYPRPVAQPVTTGEHRADDGGQPSAPTLPDVPGSRSWQRAFGDLGAGWRQRSLWGYLGWQDIKQRYRRSVLGPLWISISMGVIATAMGILYGALFGEPVHTFLPYVATGLLIWNFVNGCILEGSEVFIANEGLIRFLPAPISLHVYRLLWRQTLFFLHNLVIWLLLVIIFPQPLSATVLLALPAFLLLVINGLWLRAARGHHRHPLPRHPADHREPDAAAVLHDTDRVVLRAAEVEPAGGLRRAEPRDALRRDPAPAAAGPADRVAALGGRRRHHGGRLRRVAGLPAQLPLPRGRPGGFLLHRRLPVRALPRVQVLHRLHRRAPPARRLGCCGPR